MRIPPPRATWSLGALVLFGAALAAGCNDANGVGKTVSVSGNVTLGGVPLKGGIVTFHPDAGNTNKVEPFGTIDANGKYTLTTSLTTGQVNGAPPGKYRVTVATNVPSMGTTPTANTTVAINPIYNDQKNTPLMIDVVESGGQYDLPLKK